MEKFSISRDVLHYKLTFLYKDKKTLEHVTQQNLKQLLYIKIKISSTCYTTKPFCQNQIQKT